MKTKILIPILLLMCAIVSAQVTPADEVSPFSGSGSSEMYKGFVKLNASDAYLNTIKATLASPTFTGTVVVPTPFTIGAVSMTTTGTKLNYLTGATGTTGTATTNIVYSTAPTITTPTFAGLVTFDSSITMGVFGDATQTVLSEASSNTNVLLGVYPMVNFAGTAGKVFAGQHTRMLAITTNQTNNVSIYGAENQFRLKGVNLAAGVFAGEWAYAEQSGTSVLSGGAIFAGVNATIETAATFTAGASEYLNGVIINSAVNAGASGTINGGANFSGVYIKSSGLDWYDGIYITGATNDIKLQNEETIDNATDGIVVVTGNLEVNGTGGTNFGADSQGDDDYEISLPGVDALVAGLTVIFTANTACTDGSTLEITEVGDLDAILKLNDQATASNDIEAGSVVMVVFDGSNWQMISPAAN